MQLIPDLTLGKKWGLRFLSVLIILVSLGQSAFALTTSTNYAGTANDLLDNSFLWVTPSNATGDTTGTSASNTITTRNTNGNTLALTTFGFTSGDIPSGATIEGIQAEVEWLSSNNRMQDQVVQLTKDGTTGVGSNYANNTGLTTKGFTTYGGTTDLWGTTWTPSDLSSGSFGILLQYRNRRNSAQTVNIYRVRITVSYSIPSGPGGVTGNVSIWLKANEGTSTTTDGNALSTWSDQSGNGYDATGGGATRPRFRDNTTDNINYHPVVDFNGTSQYLQNLANGASSESAFIVLKPVNGVNGTASYGVPFGWDCLSGNLSTGTCGLSFAGITLGAFTAAIPDEVVTLALGSSTNWRSSQTGLASYDIGETMLLVSNTNAGNTATDIYEKGQLVSNYSVNTFQTLATADYNIGRSPDAANPFYYGGTIAEIINFSSRVTDSERQQIESYLALKYGITLNAGGTDYIASDGTTTIWSTSTAGSYTNSIFGIGRDDSSELGQITSKSMNPDGIVTVVAVGEGTNATPAFVDISDKEFLTISDNLGGNSWVATDSPLGYDILDRKWLYQEQGDVGAITLDIDVDDADFDIPVLNSGVNYFYIYDSNGNGSLSDEVPQVMVNTSGSIWEMASLSVTSGRIFTFATLSSSNNIPTDISISSTSTNENVASGSLIGTFTTTDLDITDTHTYSFVAGTGDDDNTLFTISGSELHIAESPDYELNTSYSIRVETDDGNGGTFQKSFTISVNNLGETITTIIDFEVSGKYSVTSGTWNRNTNNPQESSFALESDNGGGANTQSCFEVTHNTSVTGSIDFYYAVDSQAGGDTLNFYIDDVEDTNWSGNIAYTNYTVSDIAGGPHTYKWCYIKNGSVNTGLDAAWIDYIVFTNAASDSTPPTISVTAPGSGSLLPNADFTLDLSYSDAESGVNTGSISVVLRKWNGSSYGVDIAPTYVNFGGATIGASTASYPVTKMGYGRYIFEVSINDNSSNNGTGASLLYLDEPEIIISTGAIDIGFLDANGVSFSSQELTITVNTVGAAYDLVLVNENLLSYSGTTILDWDGSTGYGYEQSPYTLTVTPIGTGAILVSEPANLNVDGNRNTNIYSIQLGGQVDEQQAAGDYTGNIQFLLDVDY